MEGILGHSQSDGNANHTNDVVSGQGQIRGVSAPVLQIFSLQN
jgi:hypothetical protein